MKYAERQEQVDFFGGGDELRRTFRGNEAPVVKLAKKYTQAEPRIQKAISDSTIYEALREKLSWDVIVGVLDELRGVVADDPRTHCEPPEIAEAWADFRKAAKDYASSSWWYDVLELEGLVKPSTWQSQLSRDVELRAWPEIRARARAWRERVMAGLDLWEKNVLARSDVGDTMAQTWVKDALAHGEDAAFSELLRIRRAQSPVSYTTFCFDPAEPERAQFEFDCPPDVDEVREELAEMIRSGFPDYRPDEPQEPQSEIITQNTTWVTLEWGAYQALTEYRRDWTWDPAYRRMEFDQEPLRKLVKIHPKYAEPGEEVVEEERWLNQDEFVVDRFVWRWRDVHFGEMTINQARDRIMKEQGLDYDPAYGFHDPMHGILPPIEDVD